MSPKDHLVNLLFFCGALPFGADAFTSALSPVPSGNCRVNNDARWSLFSHSNHDDLPSRRQAITSITGVLVGGVAASSSPQQANAAVTDETDAFANTAPDSSYRGLQSDRPMGGRSQSIATPTDEVLISIPKSELSKGLGRSQSIATPTDEVLISIPKSELSKGLGIELSQIDFRTNTRVYVKSVEPGSIAAKLGIKKDYIVVSVNGKSAERTNAEGVAILVSQAVRAKPADGSVDFVFRDPALFNEKLADLSSAGQVTTQVAPAGDTTQRNQDGSVKAGRVETQQTDQRLSVSQLVPPKMCNRKATTDDLLEISYIGTVVDTGDIFDGSAIRINGEGIPGRGNDVSLYFVLKKQPFGQFPPGFDVGLEGMCVGERRRLIIPPGLAYGATGVPKRNIPPNATLQYDITLVSLNGLATPQ